MAEYVVWIAADDGVITLSVEADSAEEAEYQVPDDQTVLGVGQGNVAPPAVGAYMNYVDFGWVG